MMTYAHSSKCCCSQGRWTGRQASSGPSNWSCKGETIVGSRAGVKQRALAESLTFAVGGLAMLQHCCRLYDLQQRAVGKVRAVAESVAHALCGLDKL